MTSWFNTSAPLLHKTPIPDDISRSKAIEFLHNHVFYIKCDPHMIKYESISEPSGLVKPTVPEDRKIQALGDPVYYSVTDKVATLPAGIWDSDIVSTFEFVKVETGVFVRVYSPLSVVMETVWEVKEKEDGGLELVEDVMIKASRLLVGSIKKTCDSSWTGIHGKMVSMMQEQVA